MSKLYIIALETYIRELDGNIRGNGRIEIIKGNKYEVLFDEGNYYMIKLEYGWDIDGRSDVLMKIRERGIAMDPTTKVAWYDKRSCRVVKNEYGCIYNCDPCPEKCTFYKGE